MLLHWLLSLLAIVASALGASSTGSAVLVVLEPKLDEADYSLFFGGLRERGYQLTFRAPKDVEPQLFVHDVPQFNHVILFAPTTKSYAKDMTPSSLVALLSAHTNLLIALSPTSTPLTSLAPEFGLTPPPPMTPLLSHFPPRTTPHTTVPIALPPAHPVLSGNTTGTLLFSGAPHLVASNPLLLPVLHAPPESFAADAETDSAANADALVEAAERGGEGLWAGGRLGVVTGFQARSGARAMWVGGVDVFSDRLARTEVESGVRSANEALVRDVTRWAFQETLVLRIDNTTHHRVGETSPRETYTTNDHVVYTLHMSAYDAQRDAWVPHASLTDLQLEFTMLDPHIRTALRAVPGAPGRYQTRFRVPDRHGVFKFIVDYRRKGWTHVYASTTVPVVPPRHDGYPRFLSAAWPYYAGAVSMSVGFVVFSAVWLGGAEVARARGKVE